MQRQLKNRSKLPQTFPKLDRFPLSYETGQAGAAGAGFSESFIRPQKQPTHLT